jgi:hypothetical protein
MREQINLRTTLTGNLLFPYFDKWQSSSSDPGPTAGMPTQKVAPGAAAFAGRNPQQVQPDASTDHGRHRPSRTCLGQWRTLQAGAVVSQHCQQLAQDLVIAEIPRNLTPVMLSIGKMSIATILPATAAAWLPAVSSRPHASESPPPRAQWTKTSLSCSSSSAGSIWYVQALAVVTCSSDDDKSVREAEKVLARPGAQS